MSKEKVFADGFLFKTRENQPEWVVGSLSVKVEDAIAFLKDNHKNGWVNLNINTARSGKQYVELDTFEPKRGKQQKKKLLSKFINVTEMTIFLKYFVINFIGYTILFFLLFFLIKIVKTVINIYK